MNVATCICRKGAWNPSCPKHPPIGRARYLANLAGMVVLVCVVAVAVFTAPSQATPTRAICKVFGKRCAAAVRVARCESRLNPRAVSRTRDVGLFQVNYAAHGWRGESFAEFYRRMADVQRNVQYAYRLSRGGTSWGAWRWSRHCHGLA